MSSYNNVEKIKYFDGADGLVTLKEYIVFEDERAEEKYIVFKFSNNVSQQLLGMEFEVCQFDLDGDMVEKSVVIYNKFLAKANKTFVPNAKLKVNYACRRISVRLIKAVFDRFVWKEGDFSDNSYKFEHYAKDRDLQILASQKAEKPKKVKEPKPPKEKKAGKALPFKMKNAFRKNIAKFPGVFNFFVCLIVIVAIGLSIYFFTTRATAFTLDNYDLKIINGNEVAIYGYDGDATNLTVPETIQDYKVVRIKSGAFKDSDIKSVKFSSPSLVIEQSAFEGCKSLTSVSSSSKVSGVLVHSDAFKNCTALKTFTVPQAFLNVNCFNGCSSVTSLTFSNTEATKVSELFGGKTPAKLQEVNASRLPDGFMNGDNNQGGNSGSENEGGNTGGNNQGGNTGNGNEGGSGSEIIPPSGNEVYDPEREYAYGELTALNIAGVTLYDSCEVLDGEIITVNVALKNFTVPAQSDKFNDKVYSKLSDFSTLTVEGTRDLTTKQWSSFENVETLVLENPDITVKSLKGLKNLKTLTAPVLGNKLNDVVNWDMLQELTVTGFTGITTDYLDGMNYLSRVCVQNTVPSVDYGAFDKLYSLYSLTVPYYKSDVSFSEQFGSRAADRVQTLTVTPYYDYSIVPKGAFSSMVNLSELRIEKGFYYIESYAIDTNPYLSYLEISGSPEYAQFVIDACPNLVTVNLSINGSYPEYVEINASYEYTQTLIIEAETLSGGFLWKCDNLKYLELHAQNVKTTLYELFGTNDGETYTVDQLVLIGNFPSGFTAGVNVGNVKY